MTHSQNFHHSHLSQKTKKNFKYLIGVNKNRLKILVGIKSKPVKFLIRLKFAHQAQNLATFHRFSFHRSYCAILGLELFLNRGTKLEK